MKVIFVKNMVCDRCKSVVRNELEAAGFSVVKVDLGKIELADFSKNRMPLIEEVMQRNGFELVNSEVEIVIEKVKSTLIKKLDSRKFLDGNLSMFLAEKLNKEYSIISKLFSSTEGLTIEKYYIRLKIEKAKELIQMGEYSFSEIAYDLDYKNSSHLAKQFKTLVGMSMRDYKKSQNWNRRPFDKIV